MKKILVFILVVLIACSTNAQKVYQTKSGKVKFFSSTKVEDIEAINSQADSKLATNGQMVFMLAIKGFKFDNSLMQEHFNENYMESSKFPRATFMGTITDIKSIDFTKDGSYKTEVKGTMEIHGVKKPVIAAGNINIKGGKVSAKSIFRVKVADYGIKGNYIGDKIAKEVEITVDCKYD